MAGKYKKNDIKKNNSNNKSNGKKNSGINSKKNNNKISNKNHSKNNCDISGKNSSGINFIGDSGMRLNKFLSENGVCSRREADRLIENGHVTIDGRAAVTGERVNDIQMVCVDGKPIKRNNKLILLALNKPVGIECTADRKNKDNIIDFVHYKERVFTIGRLDKNSSGLILLTNDGDLANIISKSSNNHEKEYIVKVNKNIDEDFLTGMSSGVSILDTVTKPCIVEKIDKKTFRIILTQGLNRQIRRMCEALGYRVLGLKRIRIMNIKLGKLLVGSYRKVSEKEIEELKKLIDK